MGDAGSTPTIVMTGLEPAGLPSANPTESFWQTAHPNPITHHRSTSSLPSRASVVIIGTGISGTFATQELLLNTEDVEEVDVLVLEARTTCSGATGRNGGHLQPLIHSERSGIIDFEMRNYRAVKALIEQGDGLGCDFREVQGCLGFWNRMYFEEAKAALSVYHDEDGETTADDKRQHLYEEMKTSNHEHEVTTASKYAGEHTGTTTSKHDHKYKQKDLVRVVEDPEELKALGLTGGVVGAIVQTVAASLSPYKLIIGMWTRMLERFGPGRQRLNLQTDTPVTAIVRAGTEAGPDQNGGWIVRTAHRGDVHAGQVILATNAYTSRLIPRFANCIVPVQAQMAALVPPRDSPYARTLIPRSYGFMGVGSQDRVMSDYLVQNPILEDQDDSVVVGGGGRRRGGHLMFGGGRSEVRGHGVGVSDDDYVDEDAEIYLRGLGARLRLGKRDDTPTLARRETETETETQTEIETTEQIEKQTQTQTPAQTETAIQAQTQTQILKQVYTQTATQAETDTPAHTETQTKLLDIAASWTGIIGHSVDGLPWVGGVPGSDGIFVCAGYTGHGMTNAGLCGRHVARLVAASHRGQDWRHVQDRQVELGERGEDTGGVPREYIITQERMDAVAAA